MNFLLKYTITPTLLSQIRSIHGVTQKHFIYNKKMFSAIIVKMFLSRQARLSGGITSNLFKVNGFLQNVLTRRMSKLDVNTNVQNDVVLYKFEKTAYFRNIKIFAFAQLFSCFTLTYYTYKSSLFDIFTSDVKLKDYSIFDVFRFFLFFFFLAAGPLMFFAIYVMNSRNIKYIILNKGGKTVTIVTYHFLKKKSKMNVPVEFVKSTSSRNDIGSHVSMKIKNKSFFYLIEKEGTFVNPKLFDFVTG